jgi:hypothetical protein
MLIGADWDPRHQSARLRGSGGHLRGRDSGVLGVRRHPAGGGNEDKVRNAHVESWCYTCELTAPLN